MAKIKKWILYIGALLLVITLGGCRFCGMVYGNS